MRVSSEVVLDSKRFRLLLLTEVKFREQIGWVGLSTNIDITHAHAPVRP